MKQIILISLIFFIAAAAVSAISVRVHPTYVSGSSAGLAVVVIDHNSRHDDVAIRVELPEQDTVSRTAEYETSKGRAEKIYYELDLNYLPEPDYYPVRITITDDDGNKRKTHTWVFLG